MAPVGRRTLPPRPPLSLLARLICYLLETARDRRAPIPNSQAARHSPSFPHPSDSKIPLHLNTSSVQTHVFIHPSRGFIRRVRVGSPVLFEPRHRDSRKSCFSLAFRESFVRPVPWEIRFPMREAHCAGLHGAGGRRSFLIPAPHVLAAHCHVSHQVSRFRSTTDRVGAGARGGAEAE